MNPEAPNPAAGKYPLAIAALAVMFSGAFAPSPLYEYYRHAWGLSAGELSLVFAVYAFTLIPTLLFFGGVSDSFGRRRTIVLALAVLTAGALCLAFASGFWGLVAGRVLQGIGIGLGAGTATAAVREWMDAALRPRASSLAIVGTTAGSVFGAVLSGVLGQYGPQPTMLPYLVNVVLLVVMAALVARVPACPHLGPALHVALPTIPASIRRPFYLVSSLTFVAWATSGIFVSLLPGFLIRSLGIHTLLVGSFVVAAVLGGMAGGSLVGGRLTIRRATLAGAIVLGIGVWTLLAAIPLHAYALIAAALVAVGVGIGLCYLTGLRILSAIAPPDHLAELISAYFVACYLGFSLPALAIGFIANTVGFYNALAGAALVFGAGAVTALALMAQADIVPGTVHAQT